VQPETQSDTVTNVKAKAVVEILADTLAEVRPETLSDRLADVKVRTLYENTH